MEFIRSDNTPAESAGFFIEEVKITNLKQAKLLSLPRFRLVIHSQEKTAKGLGRRQLGHQCSAEADTRTS